MSMSMLFFIPNGWALILATYGFSEHYHLMQLTEKSHRIMVGDTEADVRAILGAPLFRWEKRDWLAAFFVGPRPRQWIYGTIVDFRRFFLPDGTYLNPLPFNLRIFGTDEADLIIDWTPGNRVGKITRPTH
jgi:hypothetical protein